MEAPTEEIYTPNPPLPTPEILAQLQYASSTNQDFEDPTCTPDSYTVNPPLPVPEILAQLEYASFTDSDLEYSASEIPNYHPARKVAISTTSSDPSITHSVDVALPQPPIDPESTLQTAITKAEHFGWHARFDSTQKKALMRVRSTNIQKALHTLRGKKKVNEYKEKDVDYGSDADIDTITTPREKVTKNKRGFFKGLGLKIKV